MAKVIPKRAGAPMNYNNAIRVDEEPILNSDALITSGGVYRALQGGSGGPIVGNYKIWIGSLPAYNALEIKDPLTIYMITTS